MRCDIILPVWNQLEITRRCIDSIAKNTHFPYRIIVIDNASDEPTKAYLERLREIGRFKYHLIRNEENFGFTKAANQGMRASDAEYLCILNNDTLVMDGWLAEMISVAEGFEDIGIVNPTNNFGKKKPWWQSYEDYARKRTSGNKGKVSETASPVGFCYMIKRQVIEKIGLWDEGFSPGYFEDTEYARRAKEAGYKSVFADGAFVWHLERASFKRRGLPDYFKRSKEIFYSKFKTPQRVLYVVSNSSDKFYNKLREDSYNLAADSNWVWIFLKRSAPKLDLANHTYIRAFLVSDAFFVPSVIFRILRRKKKFSKIFVDSPGLMRRLQGLRRLHKAQVQLL